MNFRLYVFNEATSEDKQITLIADEIKKCRVSFRPKNLLTEEGSSKHKREIYIEGNIISDIGSSNTETIETVKNIISNPLGSIGEIMNKNSLSLKTLNLYNEKTKGMKISSLSEIYKDNRTNMIGLREWYMSSTSKYRSILLERLEDETESTLLYFENIYVDEYEEEGNIENGNGTFKLLLKQKFNGESNDLVSNS